ncbi:MAG: methylated-DNA--[protein]-cysteine S-methyltransferase [Armatimonadetes bacterium]|nr:methylated-DNA--[protein]-cysteine S-methyltransferase [Armatimonadota bacterium]
MFSVFTQVIYTSAGWLAAAWTQAGLAALTLPRSSREEALAGLKEQLLLWEGQEKDKRRGQSPAGEYPCPEDCPGGYPAFLEKALTNYFQGSPADFALPVDLSWCTPFQKKVLLAIREIPCGEVRSYGQVAAAAGHPRAARAAGTTAGLNRTPVVIPCHRVVRQNGGLGGYGGGPEMKKYLLDLDARIKEKTTGT